MKPASSMLMRAEPTASRASRSRAVRFPTSRAAVVPDPAAPCSLPQAGETGIYRPTRFHAKRQTARGCKLTTDASARTPQCRFTSTSANSAIAASKKSRNSLIPSSRSARSAAASSSAPSRRRRSSSRAVVGTLTATATPSRQPQAAIPLHLRPTVVTALLPHRTANQPPLQAPQQLLLRLCRAQPSLSLRRAVSDFAGWSVVEFAKSTIGSPTKGALALMFNSNPGAL